MNVALSDVLGDEEMKSNRPYENAALWVTPGDGFLSVIRRARALVTDEGWSALLDGIGRFSGKLKQQVYRNERFRLYEVFIDDALSIPSSAPLKDMELHVFESHGDAHRLMVQGYEDVILSNPHHMRRLDSGSVAVCAFVGRKFASIDWMAFSERAKRSFDKIPYEVAFEKGEACTGGAFTVQRFRRRGIATYRFSGELRYLRNRGCCVCRNAIRVDNIPSQRPVERFGGRFNRVGHLRRVLWWTRWTETPVA